jgi:gliding motility-associated-like protein
VCGDTATDRFYIRSRRDPRFSYTTNDACSGEGLLEMDTIYSPGGRFAYTPAFSGGGSSFLSLNTTTGDINMSLSTAGRAYIVRYFTDGNCPDTSSVRVDINQSPDILSLTAEPGVSICDSQLVEFTCIGSGDVKWYVDSLFVDNGPTFVSNSLTDGDTVWAVLTEPTAGCSDTLYRVLQVLAPPTAEIADKPSTVAETVELILNLRAFQDNTMIDWSVDLVNVVVDSLNGTTTAPLFVGDLYAVPNSVSLVNAYDPGYIIMTLRPRTFGCYGSAVVDTIFVSPEGMSVYVPEVITPNNDTHNDFWDLRYGSEINPADYEIVVFNRAGAKVHTVTDLTQQWTGDTNPDGVYWWILRKKEGGEVTLSGGLTIRRF